MLFICCSHPGQFLAQSPGLESVAALDIVPGAAGLLCGIHGRKHDCSEKDEHLAEAIERLL
jgi:hypothetical protein